MRSLFASIVIGLGVLVACSDDEPAAPAPTGDDDDAGPAGPAGKADTGVIRTPPHDGGPSVQPAIDARPPCCNVTFRLPDDTGNETTAILRGVGEPLTGDGIVLGYAYGAWSATACVPIGTSVEYRFYFGPDDTRTDPSQPQVGDGAGGFYNTFGPIASCSDIDASAPPIDGGDAGADADADADVTLPDPTSSDGIQNGSETDIDCGGGAPTNAPKCQAAEKCSGADDCESGTCDALAFRCTKPGQLYEALYGDDHAYGFSGASGIKSSDTATEAATFSISKPGGIAIDTAKDILYVASDTSVLSFDAASSTSSSAARTITSVNQPLGLAVDARHDRLFVTSYGDGAIHIFDGASAKDAAAAPDRSITAIGSTSSPHGIAYDAKHDRLFVSLRGLNTIAVFDDASTVNGTYAAVAHRAITGSDIKVPLQIAYDPAHDEVYVANSDATTADHILVYAGDATGAATPRKITIGDRTSVTGLAIDPSRDELYYSGISQFKVSVLALAHGRAGSQSEDRYILSSHQQFPTQLVFDPTR